MQVQVVGTKKCKDTQKALRFFKERKIQVQFLDLNEKKLSKGELNNICRNSSPEELIDENSKQFKKRNLAFMVYDAYEEILDDPLIMKTPVVRNKNKGGNRIPAGRMEAVPLRPSHGLSQNYLFLFQLINILIRILFINLLFLMTELPLFSAKNRDISGIDHSTAYFRGKI